MKVVSDKKLISRLLQTEPAQTGSKVRMQALVWSVPAHAALVACLYNTPPTINVSQSWRSSLCLSLYSTPHELTTPGGIRSTSWITCRLKTPSFVGVVIEATFKTTQPDLPENATIILKRLFPAYKASNKIPSAPACRCVFVLTLAEALH